MILTIWLVVDAVFGNRSPPRKNPCFREKQGIFRSFGGGSSTIGYICEHYQSFSKTERFRNREIKENETRNSGCVNAEAKR